LPRPFGRRRDVSLIVRPHVSRAGRWRPRRLTVRPLVSPDLHVSEGYRDDIARVSDETRSAPQAAAASAQQRDGELPAGDRRYGRPPQACPALVAPGPAASVMGVAVALVLGTWGTPDK
jgi:hypothetical protein